MNNNNNGIGDQIIGSMVNTVNQVRISHEMLMQSSQDHAFQLATEQMQNVRDFITSPEHILGSMNTKHGEIAEQVEVGVRNARQAIEEQIQDVSEFKATFDNVGRTAPADYMIDGVEVQSKFINGTSNTLNHVLQHIEKYPDFAGKEAFYHIPKDTWQTICDVMDGKPVEGMSDKTISVIRDKVAEIESMSGRSFTDVIRSGVSDYKDIQWGKIDETLDEHDQQLAKQNDVIKEEIANDHRASINEGMQAAAMGAAFGGAFALATVVYKKYRAGKNIFNGDFNKQDWQDLGLDTLKGSAVGGVSASAIYTLTNFASMSAPFAGALVTAAKGIGNLFVSYQRGEIDANEFADLGLIICAESAIVGAMSVVGQSIIPVPILGALIGSISGKFMVTVAKNMDNKARRLLTNKMAYFTSQLNALEQKTLQRLLSEFMALGDLTTAAFNVDNNRQLLEVSITLAKAHGVEESKIIKNSDDLDAFMMS